MDTTYFGRSFGIMVLMDSISGKALSVSKVKYETNELYAQAIGSLKAKGIEIQSIVCDGRRGLPQMLPDIPRYSRTALSVPSSQNHQPLLNPQPQNRSRQSTLATGFNAEKQQSIRL